MPPATAYPKYQSEAAVKTNNINAGQNSFYPHHPQETRPSNIISPPINKYPKLSPDSGFPGSPTTDLLDTSSHVPLVQNIQSHNPSIIKQQTDSCMNRHPAPVIMNDKIQRRFSASQLSPQPHSPSVINKNVEPETTACVAQRRISSGPPPIMVTQQVQHNPQRQLPQNILMKPNQNQYVLPLPAGRPSIVKYSSNVITQQQQQQQSTLSSRPPASVLQQVAGHGSNNLQIPTQNVNNRIKQQQILVNRITSTQTAVLPTVVNQQAGMSQSRPRTMLNTSNIHHQVRLPQQPLCRPTSVLQLQNRPPPEVMSAVTGPRPISLQSRNVVSVQSSNTNR